MELYANLPDYQKALQARAEAAVPGIRNLGSLSASQQSNKFAQNAQISTNISAKAQELVELIEAPQASFNIDGGNASSFLAEIEEKGLAEVLQSRVSVDINGLGESLRGSTLDVAG